MEFKMLNELKRNEISEWLEENTKYSYSNKSKFELNNFIEQLKILKNTNKKITEEHIKIIDKEIIEIEEYIKKWKKGE